MSYNVWGYVAGNGALRSRLSGTCPGQVKGEPLQLGVTAEMAVERPFRVACRTQTLPGHMFLLPPLPPPQEAGSPAHPVCPSPPVPLKKHTSSQKLYSHVIYVRVKGRWHGGSEGSLRELVFWGCWCRGPGTTR